MSSDSESVVKNEIPNGDKSDVTSASMHNSDAEIGVLAESKTSESVLNHTTSDDSEYESISDKTHTEESSQSSGSEAEPDEDERGDGDGQEENSAGKDKKLDDDEDRRNPQYIPKKGTFYEHDDRTMLDENGEQGGAESTEGKPEEEEPARKAGGGRVWAEPKETGGSRWSHDLYDEDAQAPKTAQELIDTYGYDIRNEEAPPKARRRRRYGRGPNKYTRNWEDEDAYVRQTTGHGQRKVFNNNRESREEFPELDVDKPRRRESKSPRAVPPEQRVREEEREKGERPRERVERERAREPRREVRPKPPPARRPPSPPPTVASHTRTFTPSAATRRPSPPAAAPVTRLEPASLPRPPMVIGLGPTPTADPPARGRGRGFRGTNKPRPVDPPVTGRGRGPPPSFDDRDLVPVVEDSLKHAADILVQDFSHIYISGGGGDRVQSTLHAQQQHPSQMPTNIVEETIIPRSERRSHGGGGDTKSTSHGKRYSSQRQRTLPETTPPPAYSPPVAPHTIPYYTQPPPNGYVPSGVYTAEVPPAVSSPPMQMVAFLPPPTVSVPPPAAAAAPPYPPPPLLTAHPHPHFMPPPAFQPLAMQPALSGQFDDLAGVGVGVNSASSAEVFQSQGGITYYSTQTQSALPRATPPRRVKLAIPIVPPPSDNRQSAS